MAIRSVFIPQPVIDGDLIRIRDEEHQHLHVARGRAEEPVEIFDGRGNVWDAVIVSIERRETVVRVTGGRQVAPDPFELTLGQSLIRSSAFEYALEKAVETGVTRIIPIAAARSNAKDAGRRERWQKIIIEAAKQSKRYHLPALDEPRSFENALAIEARTKIVFAERNGGPLKPAISGSPVLYLVGPEGGWTEEELNLAEQQGFSLVGLGPSILKSETAAVVATSLLRYELQHM
jgi:16S rRNA (uracil1498-N3)-methyltransferase